MMKVSIRELSLWKLGCARLWRKDYVAKVPVKTKIFQMELKMELGKGGGAAKEAEIPFFLFFS